MAPWADKINRAGYGQRLAESGHLASTQDVQTWNRRMGLRQKNIITPHIIMPTIDRLQKAGALPMSDISELTDSWIDLNIISDTEKAAVALQRTQALMQYTTGGIEEVMDFLDFCVHIMGFDLQVAQMIVENSTAQQRKKLTEKVWQEPISGLTGQGTRKKPSKSGNTSRRPARDSQG